MAMSKTLFALPLMLLTLLGLPLSSTASAATNNTRFVVPGAEDNLGASNVAMAKTDFSKLPTEMAGKIERLLKSCVTEQVSPKSLEYYLYVSDRNRQRKLPPNILIDFSSLKDKKIKECYDPEPLCEEGQCLLSGYTVSNTGTWERGLMIRVGKWAPATFKANRNSKSTTTIFQVTSDNPDCDLHGGKKQYGKCVQNFIWSGQDVKIYQ